MKNFPRAETLQRHGSRRIGCLWQRVSIFAVFVMMTISLYPFQFALDSSALHRSIAQTSLTWSPTNPTPFGPMAFATVLAAFAYGVSLAIIRGLQGEKRSREYLLLQAWIPVVLCEVIQLFSIHAIARTSDLIINLTGAAAGSLVGALISIRLQPQKTG
jgi:VanZ family protein